MLCLENVKMWDFTFGQVLKLVHLGTWRYFAVNVQIAIKTEAGGKLEVVSAGV